MATPEPATVFRWAVAGTCGVLAVLLAAYGLYLVRSILVLVLIALFIAISFEPVVVKLTGWGLPRGVAVAIVIAALVVLTLAFLWSVVPALADQGGRLIDDAPAYLRQLTDDSRQVREVTDRYHLTDRLASAVAALPGTIATGAVGFFQHFLGAVSSGLTVLVLSIYFMADLPRLRRVVLWPLPERHRARGAYVLDVVVDKVGGYMIGNIIISVFAGTAAFLCLEAVGVPFALPLAVTVAICDLIPMIGATLGAAICVLVALFTVGLWPRTVIVIIFFVLYQLAENYLLVPRVFRNTVDMPAAAVLLVALTGGTLLGLAGVIMAIPIAATIKVVLTPATTTGSPDG
jgi:predicted PurR-regulated permease PerM